MANETKEFFEKFKKDMGKMKELAPDTVQGFSAAFSKIMQDGALGLKEKELIALAIGVTQHCKPCIRLHVQKCFEAGATKEQILEAASIAVIMGGGPAYTHIPVVIDVLEALQAD
jgi:AhpD family alkylhydroperoxidase